MGSQSLENNHPLLVTDRQDVMEEGGQRKKAKSKLEYQYDSSLSSRPQSSSHEREVLFPFYIRDFCARVLTLGARFAVEWRRFKLSRLLGIRAVEKDLRRWYFAFARQESLVEAQPSQSGLG